jgi:hypothetical protein
MRKAFIFFLMLAVLIIIACTTSLSKKPKEGFQTLMGMEQTSMNEGTPEALYTKLPIKQPTNVVGIAEAGVGNIQPSPPPASDLPTAPIDQRAKETPSPYINPVVEPAKYIQILGVKEDLQAFFGFQAFVLEERNDPSIQLPMTRARGDMGELIAVQSVMERNPGLQSRITNKQLDDIRSNLRYLRDILHDLEASGAVQPEALEAFADMSTQTSDISGERATLKELQEFQIKVVVEINRVGASGTSDPIVQARLRTLQLIKTDVDDVIEKLQNGSITPETVPIYKSDINRALPVLGKPTSPLGTLVKKNKLPPAFASLFPGGLSPKDTEQANQINNVAKGYMNNLLEGASWGINVMFKYDNPNVLRMKAMAAMNPENPVQGIPGIVKKDIQINPNDSYTSSSSSANSITLGTDASYNPGLPGTSNPSTRVIPPNPAGTIDWKQRSQQITEQIRKRGLTPTDFGAMPENVQVSDSYSWRGYTQMLCSRLNTTPDPGLAVSVGCPPNNWPGWR